MTGHSRLDPVDVLLYAPLGAALSLRKDLPRWAVAGRKRIDTEIVTARSIGKVAVGRLRQRLDPTSSSGGGRPTRPSQPSGPQRPVRSATAPPPSVAPVVPSEAAEPAIVVAAADLPIADYDSLSAVQVVPRLGGLRRSDLDAVEAYEAAGRGRRTILHRIDQIRSRS